MALADHRVVRVSARPPSKFSATADFALWIQRFEIYLSEAEIPLEKRARELLSLLDDGPFRIVTQLGLVDSNDYSCVKEQLQKHYAPKGDDLEWQYRLQNRRQKSGEPLSEFVGELRMMTDKAYPEWEPKQRLEIARNQFIQGIESPSIQLVLMREKPKTLEDALALAQQHLAVETAQKRLHRRPLEQHAAQSLDPQTMTVTVNTRSLEPPPSPVIAANGEQLEICGLSEVNLRVGDICACYPVLVAKNVTQECLLGADFLEKFGCIIDLRGRTLTTRRTSVPIQFRKTQAASSICHVSCAETTVIPGRHQLELPAQLCPPKNQTGELVGTLEPGELFMERHGLLIARSVHSVSAGKEKSLVRILNPSPAPVTIYCGERLGVLQPLESALESATLEEAELGSPPDSTDRVGQVIRQLQSRVQGLSEAENEALKTLLSKFPDVISLHSNDLGRTSVTVVRHKIHTGDATPVKQPPRRLPFHQREPVRKMLDDMLQQGVIEPASGPWSSPIVLVPKKDGTPRFCVDYRRVNSLTRKDAHPLPRIDDTLDALSGAKWFSTLDLASGYWQVEVEPSDREKTAFATSFGLHQFRVMPFGLCNAPSTFQRLMELALTGLHWSICLVYLDDIIIYSRTVSEHLQHLQEVLQRLRAAGLKLKPSKCYLLQKSVHYLGHIISECGIKTDPQKTRCIEEWPIPTCVGELRQFLGLATYYRKFVKNFAQVAAPLHRLTERNKVWTWAKECNMAFITLKEKLTSAPILAFPQLLYSPFLTSRNRSFWILMPVHMAWEQCLPKMWKDKTEWWLMLAGHSPKLNDGTVSPAVKCLPWYGLFVTSAPTFMGNPSLHVLTTTHSSGCRVPRS